MAFVETLSAAQRQVLAEDMGLDLEPGRGAFELRALQFTRKISPDGVAIPQVLLSFIQERAEGGEESSGAFSFRGGCTVVVDLLSKEIEYVIRKNVRSETRLAAERAFHLQSRAGLAEMYLGAVNEADPSRQLALLHGLEPELGNG